MILNYVIKYITKLFDIPFCFMQYVCKNVCKLFFCFFPLNTVYLLTVSNLHINVLLLGQHVEKTNCHNGSNKWPDFHNIS